MFLTYEEFLAYGGSTDVTLAEFTRTERKAEAFIDGITHRRVKDETPVRECVKLCAFELTQLELGYAKADAGNPAEIGISSQSNDGVSVTYGSRADVEKSRCNRRKDIACEYLAWEFKGDVPLLYAGVEYDEYREQGRMCTKNIGP